MRSAFAYTEECISWVSTRLWPDGPWIYDSDLQTLTRSVAMTPVVRLLKQTRCPPSAAFPKPDPEVGFVNGVDPQHIKLPFLMLDAYLATTMLSLSA